MKFLQNIFLLLLLTNQINLKSPVLANDEFSNLSCKIQDSERLRSKMYEESPEINIIMDLERQSCELILNKEVKKLANTIIDENGLILSDHGGILYGREQQERMFNSLVIQNIGLIYEPVEAHVSESKGMAWVWGVYRLELPNKQIELGKYLSIWEKKSKK